MQIAFGIFRGGSTFDWVFEWFLCKINFYFWNLPFWEFLLKDFFPFFFADFQQSVKNVNQRIKTKRTLKTSNSKVIASSLLLVLVLSAICDVTGESFDGTFSAFFAHWTPTRRNARKIASRRIIDTPESEKMLQLCLTFVWKFPSQVKIRRGKKFACEWKLKIYQTTKIVAFVFRPSTESFKNAFTLSTRHSRQFFSFNFFTVKIVDWKHF